MPAAGFALKSIEISGIQRGLTHGRWKKNLKTLKLYISARSDCRQIIKNFEPDIVVGFGGYVGGTVVRVAQQMRIKTAIHEQNAFPGVANKYVAPRADLVMLTSQDAASRIKCKNEPILTGLPIRDGILSITREQARESLYLKDDEILVLSFGGSLGARRINECMLDVMKFYYNEEQVRFIHSYGQYGRWLPEAAKKEGIPLGGRFDIREYIDDMQLCLNAADIVVCRSGASTLAELECAGVPSILIPSPNVAENHQYHNAMELFNCGAAIVIEEGDLTSVSLMDAIDSLVKSNETRRQMGRKAMTLAHADAAEKMSRLCIELAEK